jgi:hypothetical protein
MARKTALVLAAAICALAAVPGAAAAAEVAFAEAPSSGEAKVVASIYSGFVAAHPGMRVQTATFDLQGLGTASIAARFVSDATCGKDGRCETVVLFFSSQEKAWRGVFEHMVGKMTIEPPDSNPAAGNMATISADGVRWIWSGFDHYMPDLASLGTPFGKPGAASAGVASAASIAVAPMLYGLPVTYSDTQLDLEASSPAPLPAHFVSATGGGVCGNAVGCPYALLVRSPGGLKSVWSGMAFGPGAIMASSSHGLRDVAIGTSKGYAVYRFDGAQYQEIETSFPSPLTPAP